MELAFALDAVRRYGWIVAVCAVLGLVPGLLGGQEAAPQYESRAIMLLAPARDVRTQISLSGANERYVLGQIEVLRSSALADRVAAATDQGPDAALQDLVSIAHNPQTDVIALIIRADSPERAEAIAGGYADTYLDLLSEQVDTARSPQVDEIAIDLDEVRTELALVDADIAAAMEPFLLRAASPEEAAAIPTVEQVAPELYSERQILFSKLIDLQAAQTQLQVGSPFVVATEVIERATPATIVPSGPSRILAAAGLLLGALVGVFLALVAGRLSPRLLSQRHAEDLLGVEVLGPVELATDHTASLTGSRSVAADAALSEIRSAVESTDADEPRLVLVTDTVVSNGSTPVALSVAVTLALGGARTVLVEAIAGDRSVSDAIVTTKTKSGPWREAGLAPTDQKLLALYTAGPTGPTWHPSDVDHLDDVVRPVAERLVVAAGAMGQGNVLQLLADRAAVVVVVLSRYSRTRSLATTLARLTGRVPRVVMVWVDEPRRRGRSKSHVDQPAKATATT